MRTQDGTGGAGPPSGPTALLTFPGVAEQIERVQQAAADLARHPVNRRGWPRTAAAASIRAARASSLLDGGSGDLTGATVQDPVLAGALRVAAEQGALATVWRRAPLQALARMHALAAADLAPAESLGRPRADPGVQVRLRRLADLVAARTVPAPVLVAVVHGELLACEPFGTVDGVVARAAARVAGIAADLDPKGLAVPESGQLARRTEYAAAAAGWRAGTSVGVARWLSVVTQAWLDGAREGTAIADALAGASSS
ncbi:oxidoreductase [Nakamurella leprariae]|uniref:Oxidoreductase n=1 Tax=Nakamurella leprariae TaxID=2803911 RepID=A0A938Y7D9_9ACTN|nr:oxidoreductase [Nakamurella leprariae]MBM9467401.1 oxidoreductase [Nakamurella leprariae]